MRKLLLTAFFAAFGLLAGAPAHAQGAEAAIAARKASMHLTGAAAGVIKRAVDAKDDVKSLKALADALANWGKAAPGMFVPGSDKGDTKALPVAFSDHDGLMKAGMALNAAALKLSAAAEANDKAAFAAAFSEVGAACGACHRAFRAR